MKTYHGFYGENACIRIMKNGSARLTIRTAGGNLIHAKDYKNERGAKIAMGRLGDSWREKGM